MNQKPSIGTFRRLLTAPALLLLTTATAWAGPTYKVLHAFGNGSDGAGLWSSVILDGKGSIYGTTSGGGTHRGEQPSS